MVENPAAYFIEYNDGLRATLLMLNGALGDYCFAARLKGVAAPQSTQFFLSPTPNVTYSACLAYNIDRMFSSGVAPYPVERTLLTSGMTLAGVESMHRGQVPVATPEMAVRYSVGPESTYWQD